MPCGGGISNFSELTLLVQRSIVHGPCGRCEDRILQGQRSSGSGAGRSLEATQGAVVSVALRVVVRQSGDGQTVSPGLDEKASGSPSSRGDGPDEFLRRFLLHTLPGGFVRIRHFGFLANRKRAALLPLCFYLLGSPNELATATDRRSAAGKASAWNCPQCGGVMVVIDRFTAAAALARSPPPPGIVP
jgi:putative transposase